jgi:hypothetical protein
LIPVLFKNNKLGVSVTKLMLQNGAIDLTFKAANDRPGRASGKPSWYGVE